MRNSEYHFSVHPLLTSTPIDTKCVKDNTIVVDYFRREKGERNAITRIENLTQIFISSQTSDRVNNGGI